MQWKAYRGITAVGGFAVRGSQRVLFHAEWLTDAVARFNPAKFAVPGR
jgi:hypothetical protein